MPIARIITTQIRDGRPTARQILDDEGLEGRWTDRVVLVTGCSSGLGVETAQALFTTGATLYLTARDLSKAKTALGDIAHSERVHLLQLDLNSLKSVRACAQEFLSKFSPLHVLIANAGIMACPEGRTEDGFELQMGTNHLAHFLLINLLKDTLIKSATPEFNSRVVILASVAHRFAEVNFDNINLDGAYDPWVACGASKTANLWTANELERRYGSRGLHAWSVQPGGVAATGLMQHLPDDAKEGSASDPVLSKIFKNPAQGAATTTWGATAKALEGKGGKYLEDCQIARAWVPEAGQWGHGYASWAYDAEKEGRLWAESLKLVGLSDDS